MHPTAHKLVQACHNDDSYTMHASLERGSEYEDRICTSSGEARQGGEAEPAAEQMEQLRRRIAAG